MKLCINRAVLFIVLLLVLLPYPVKAENEVLSVEIEKGKTEVTLLEGKAFLEKKTRQKLKISVRAIILYQATVLAQTNNRG